MHSRPFGYYYGAQDNLALVNVKAEAFYISGFKHFVQQKSISPHKRRREVTQFFL